MERKNFIVEKLKVRVFDTRAEMGKNAAIDAAESINRIIQTKGEATVVFAAAPSQNELLENLKLAEVDWKKVRAFHMDEYIGLPSDHPAGFGNFLDRAIFKSLPFKECFYIRDGGPDAEGIISRYTQLLEKYPPDIVCQGIGENGHLAFNDPPVADFNDPFPVKVVELDDICRTQQVNDGCFPCFDDVPKTAVTLTISALLKIPLQFTVVPGIRKADAVLKTLSGPITAECPASILRKHGNCVLYLDSDSAKKIENLF